MSISSSSASSSGAPINHKRRQVTEEVVDSDAGNSDSQSESSSSKTPQKAEVISTADDEEPVLSHAARRKQKKQETRKRKQQNEEVDSTKPTKKRKLKDGSVAIATSSKDTVNGQRIKRQNSIWVGNMSFKTTEVNLRAFFEGKGIGGITRIHMPTKAATRPGPNLENRGFAYVDFDTPEAKQAAIAVSEQPLLGRKLLIKDGDDFSGRPNHPAVEAATILNAQKTLSKTAQKILRNQKQPPAPTLFFGNLSFDTTEDAIRELLEAHRPGKGKRKEKTVDSEEVKEGPWIRKVRIGTFEDSGKCKGFAFVDFLGTEYATSALINPKNYHLNGRNLVIEYASPDAVRRGAPKISKHGPQPDVTGKIEKQSKVKKNPPSHKSKSAVISIDQEAMDVKAIDNVGSAAVPQKRSDTYQRSDNDRGKLRGRPKPGAALALAKRESTAIVPSQGQKITF